jgi:hypothetical protein
MGNTFVHIKSDIDPLAFCTASRMLAMKTSLIVFAASVQHGP